MADDLLYLMIKAAFCLGVFYLVYMLLLKNETFFLFNRLYLLLTVVLSMIIPLMHIRLPELITGNGNPYMLDLISVGSWFVEETMPETEKSFQVLLMLYLAGCAIFLSVFLVRACRLVALILRSGIHRIGGWKLVFNPVRNSSPFSFLGFVFISREEFRSHSAGRILMHERVHISQRHSFDLLFIEIITIVQWFNPFIWLYRRSVVQQHEYLADEGVLRHYGNVQAYQGILLHVSTGMHFHKLTHPFSHSLLKRRFIMMSKPKSGPRARWKLLAVFPVIAVLLFLFKDVSGRFSEQVLNLSQPFGVTWPLENLAAFSVMTAQTVDRPQVKPDTTFTVVEQMPTFRDGGHVGLVQYIVQHVKYPEEAKKQGISGTVYVTFIIDEKGKVLNAGILRGIGGGCDEEALRVVQSMPDWNPGLEKGKAVKVQFNLPIRFSLDDPPANDTEKDVKTDVNKDHYQN